MSGHGESNRLAYEPGLDGLRGIAVILVMGSHFGIIGFAGGGLVGVTLFFVLSGFLITSLLLAERRATGTVDLLRFYGRRAGRLLPALALLLVVVGLGVWLGAGQADVAASGVITSALYVSNLAVAANTNLGPLEHTWSLAIEEQFYLLWPGLLLGVIRWPRILGAAIIAVIAVAAVLRIGPLADSDHLWFAYHHTFTRIDAILVGCLLALVRWRPTLPLALTAAAMLAAVVVLPLAPGTLIVVLLLPVTVAAAILVAARPAILGWGPLVAVGKISYGLYLWHFPVVAVLPPILAVPATLAIAFASYRWLEHPIRRLARDWRPRLPSLASERVALAEVRPAVLPSTAPPPRRRP